MSPTFGKRTNAKGFRQKPIFVLKLRDGTHYRIKGDCYEKIA